MIKTVICDDEIASETIIRYFTQKGDLFLDIAGTAHDGQEAAELIRKTMPTLVFMDVFMPVKTGFDVIREVQDIIDPGRFIIITGYKSFESAQTALRMGAGDIILKPLSLEPLQQSINKVMGWKVTGNDLTNKAVEYIHGHYGEDITLSSVAETLFCSPAHLTRSFKANMGCSVMNYLRDVRIKKAVSLLERKDLSINEVARAVGYPSMNGFYQAFKLVTGSTPAAYSRISGGQPHEINE